MNPEADMKFAPVRFLLLIFALLPWFVAQVFGLPHRSAKRRSFYHLFEFLRETWMSPRLLPNCEKLITFLT